MPGTTAAVLEIVSVDVAELFGGGVTDELLKVHDAVAGQPPTVRLTALLNPFNDVTVMVEVFD